MARGQQLTILAAVLALICASPAEARQYTHLSKPHARAAGYKFVAPFVDLLDIQRTVQTHMVRPGLCHRVSARTISCYFWAYLVGTHELVDGSLRVHLQRDGLLGFLIPFDPWDHVVPPSGEPASTDGVAQPVEVGVQ